MTTFKLIFKEASVFLASECAGTGGSGGDGGQDLKL